MCDHGPTTCLSLRHFCNVENHTYIRYMFSLRVPPSLYHTVSLGEPVLHIKHIRSL